MSLEFLNQTPERAFRKLERDLLLVNPDLDLRKFKSMTPRKLGENIAKLDLREQKIISESVYGSWLKDDRYVELKLLKEALEFLKEYKEGKEASETLVPRFTYYRGVKQFGQNLFGQRCFYIGESQKPMWVKFRLPVSIAKAFEVMRHGTDDDFRKIYVEMADGRSDGVAKVTLGHLTESSKDALAAIEEYCNERWEGPWPWEIPSPYKLRNKIEENREMRHESINEMRDRFNHLLEMLKEQEMDKYEVISAAEEMTSKIQGMIEDLGKIAGQGMLTLKDNARAAFGDQTAENLEGAVSGQINQAADQLSRLRASMEQVVEQMKSDGGMDDTGMGGDLGSPMDALGPEPGVPGEEPEIGGEDELAGDLADVNLGGEETERPKKEL